MESNVCIPTNKGYLILKTGEIVCCEAQNTYTVFHLLNNEQVLSTKSLLDYENALGDLSFLRVHKSWMINMSYLREYRKGEGGTAIMVNGTEVDVSRRKKDGFMNFLKKNFRI